MKRIFALTLSLALVVLLEGCASTTSRHGDAVHITLLHFNDIYEITPVSGGKEGGPARVATLRQQLLAKNPNTITTLGGDLFSPSAVGTAKVDGDRLAGKQMVDVLNHLGVDYVTFGNHEFDIKRDQFYARLKESKSTWVSSNVFDENGKPFPGVHENLIIPVTDPQTGKTVKIGMFGVTLTTNKPDYVSYRDPFDVAAEQVKKLADKVDVLIALTHQSISDDELLIQRNPEIDMVLGGHEHENYQRWRGRFVPIFKGDGNVRSVYVVELYVDPAKPHNPVIKPRLIPITDKIADDPNVAAVANKWLQLAFDAFRKEGLEPEDVITRISEPLDGLEADVRTRPTNITRLIADSMLLPYADAELSVFNSGSIRIDDVLPVGEITVYDIIRVLPFGGNVQLAQIKGDLLIKALEGGLANRGAGGFLQTAGVGRTDSGQWQVNGVPIDTNRQYKIAINDFLAGGREQNLEFLSPANPDFSILDPGTEQDLRKLVIEKLKRGT